MSNIKQKLHIKKKSVFPKWKKILEKQNQEMTEVSVCTNEDNKATMRHVQALRDQCREKWNQVAHRAMQRISKWKLLCEP